MSLTDVSAQMQKQVWTKSSFEQNESTVVYIPWRLTNDGCFGCASFWWLVNQTYIPSQGQYRYDIWFSSNSYYANGVLASTYVQGLYFNIDGYNLYQEPSWLLFKEKFNSTLTSFYSSNPTPVVHMTWSSMKVY
jgi:hypothetical protein